MGYETACVLTLDGRRYRGTARLEQKDLAFRGEVRLDIPFSQIVELQARDGSLVFGFAGRRAAFEIGPAADKWAGRIANPPSRIDKLGVKAGMRVLVVGVDDPSLARDLDARGVSRVEGRAADLDAVFFGARSAVDLRRLPQMVSRLRPNGAIWVIRAKGRAAPVSEAESMAAGKRAGLVDVKVVSFSETHSAEKYVIPLAKRAAAKGGPAPRRTRTG